MRSPLSLVMALAVTAGSLAEAIPSETNRFASACIREHDELPYRVRTSTCRCLSAKDASLRGWVEWVFVSQQVRAAADLNVCLSKALADFADLPPVHGKQEDLDRAILAVTTTGSLRAQRSWFFPHPRDPVRPWPSNVASP